MSDLDLDGIAEEWIWSEESAECGCHRCSRSRIIELLVVALRGARERADRLTEGVLANAPDGIERRRDVVGYVRWLEEHVHELAQIDADHESELTAARERADRAERRVKDLERPTDRELEKSGEEWRRIGNA